jgi:hypothetical protein
MIFKPHLANKQFVFNSECTLHFHTSCTLAQSSLSLFGNSPCLSVRHITPYKQTEHEFDRLLFAKCTAFPGTELWNNKTFYGKPQWRTQEFFSGRGFNKFS